MNLPYTRDLRAIAEAQKLCDELMQHWQEELGIPIHTVDYEHLVMDLESGARALIEHCGLSWDDRCLQFHLSATQVDTLSYDQVRRPMYSTSVGRADRFGASLDPLRKALAGEPSPPVS